MISAVCGLIRWKQFMTCSLCSEPRPNNPFNELEGKTWVQYWSIRVVIFSIQCRLLELQVAGSNISSVTFLWVITLSKLFTCIYSGQLRLSSFRVNKLHQLTLSWPWELCFSCSRPNYLLTLTIASVYTKHIYLLLWILRTRLIIQPAFIWPLSTLSGVLSSFVLLIIASMINPIHFSRVAQSFQQAPIHPGLYVSPAKQTQGKSSHVHVNCITAWHSNAFMHKFLCRRHMLTF